MHYCGPCYRHIAAQLSGSRLGCSSKPGFVPRFFPGHRDSDHNIVPVTVPVNTLLYHGRAVSNLPTVPDWTTFDPECSYTFCGTPGPLAGDTMGCWHLTLITTRPMKVLYFDGSSGAKMREGSLDTQDLLILGEVNPIRLNERIRIERLCAWGKDLGIDGYVQMEMSFELMLCDFHNGVKLLSADFVAAWWAPMGDSSVVADPPMNQSPIFELLHVKLLRAGSWHNHDPGKTHVILDLTRLVLFYDPTLAPSLFPLRADNEWSGVDWQVLYRVLADRWCSTSSTRQHPRMHASTIGITTNYWDRYIEMFGSYPPQAQDGFTLAIEMRLDSEVFGVSYDEDETIDSTAIFGLAKVEFFGDCMVLGSILTSP
ncbi:hypothetical protein DFH07DRAFT_781717 [Mycena maculata]|uniref:Uncharacterized protein n=1 Tax=Mycena maculata TaxID=230809 RepID=A0AAD7HYN4_9AGAR|nr:hypothetical protein DFH07DRAFT_781717 [Mycena maculata]